MGSSLGNADSPSLSSQQLPCSSSPSSVFKSQLSAPRLPDLAALRLFGHDLGISTPLCSSFLQTGNSLSWREEGTHKTQEAQKLARLKKKIQIYKTHEAPPQGALSSTPLFGGKILCSETVCKLGCCLCIVNHAF